MNINTKKLAKPPISIFLMLFPSFIRKYHSVAGCLLRLDFEKLTVSTLEKSRRGEDVQDFESLEAMFDSWKK